MLFLKKKEHSEKAKTAKMKDSKMYRDIFTEVKQKARVWKIEYVDRGSVQEFQEEINRKELLNKPKCHRTKIYISPDWKNLIK